MSAIQFPIAAFEDGMIARLQAASDANVGNPAVPLLGYRLREITTYKGQLAGGPQRIVEHIRSAPAVWVAFERAPYNDQTGLWDATFTAVCFATNARNERDTRQGAGGEPGSYQIGRDAAGLLDGFDFGVPGCTLMRCKVFDSPFNLQFEQVRAAYTLLTFVVSWDPADLGPAGVWPLMPGEPNSEGLGDFETFDVGWDIPPFTVPTPAPPQEGVANTLKAEDTITVNTES